MNQQEEQAVIIRASITSDDPEEFMGQLTALEDELLEAIELARVGEFDGNEVGQGELKLYMYGPDAEQLFSIVEPLLRRAHLTRLASATVRYGPPGSKSRQVVFVSR